MPYAWNYKKKDGFFSKSWVIYKSIQVTVNTGSTLGDVFGSYSAVMYLTKQLDHSPLEFESEVETYDLTRRLNEGFNIS